MKNKKFIGSLFFIGVSLLTFVILINYAQGDENNINPSNSFLTYFDVKYIDSIVFEQATLGEYCDEQVDVINGISTCSSGSTKQIITGYAVLKYNTQKILENLPESKKEAVSEDPTLISRNYEKSYPFPIIIIDDEAYIGAVSGGYAPSVGTEKLRAVIRDESSVTQDASGISSSASSSGGVWNGYENFLKSRREPSSESALDRETGESWNEWSITSLTLPDGLGLRNSVLYHETITQNENSYTHTSNFENLYFVDLDLSSPEAKEIQSPLGGTITNEYYNVEGVSYKKYTLFDVTNTIKNLEIKK
ncbi:MAG: hypothetical protein AABX28_02160 [Nanoarchaeota archaeon]